MSTTVQRNSKPGKTEVNELAAFGGPRAFSEALHVGRPNIGNRERFEERVGEILDNRWLTNNGPYVKRFEQRIADFVGVKHCVAMCNATIALEIAIRASGMLGEVIVPSFTFIATANALEWQGITPVFCDIDPATYNLNPDLVEELITPRTTGILPVHVFGRACDIARLSEIARRRDLKLLFDSAHAFGCSYKGQMIGRFGNAEVFSFHATKFLNSLEGGAIVTNDDELAKRIRLMKNFGFTNYDQTDYLGTNGKMNEVSAAMGLTNLESLTDFVATNRRNYRQYLSELAGLNGVSVLTYDETESCNYQYIVLTVDENKTVVKRDQMVDLLHAENVLVRRYFYPGCHEMQPYCSRYEGARKNLLETERLAKSVICLPTGTAVDQQHITTVCETIRLIVNNGSSISERLASLSKNPRPPA